MPSLTIQQGNNCVAADTACGCTMDGVFHPVSSWFEIREGEGRGEEGREMRGLVAVVLSSDLTV